MKLQNNTKTDELEKMAQESAEELFYYLYTYKKQLESASKLLDEVMQLKHGSKARAKDFRHVATQIKEMTTVCKRITIEIGKHPQYFSGVAEKVRKMEQ